MRILLILVLSFNILLSQHKTILLDDFENISQWSVIKSEGAELKISNAEGINGKCIRIDYNFKYGTGYCGIQRKLNFELPNNYRFSFLIKANSPNNNLEIKFLDETKENVWWMNNRNFDFPSDWKKFFVRKRNIQFAWGPSQNKDFRNFSYIEFTVASFNGGSGTIYLDELNFEEILDTTKSELKIYPANLNIIIDGNNKTSYSSTSKQISFITDFGKSFEVGGLKIFWKDNSIKNLRIYESPDSIFWNKILDVNGISKKFSYFLFKDLETRFLKYEISSQRKIQISELKFYDYQFKESKNNIFFDFAESNYKNSLPEYFSKKATYWTVSGMINDEKEALIDKNGMVEVDKNYFSILPFIEKGNQLLTYNDFKRNQRLEEEYLPLPIVEWVSKDLKLVTQIFSWGIPNKSTKLFIEYRLVNQSRKKINGKLHLAILPFQVNPYYQFLNNPGGVSKVDSIICYNNSIVVNEKRLFLNIAKPSIRVYDFDKNDAISALVEKNISGNCRADNPNKLNSGLVTYKFSIDSRDTIKLRLIYDYYNSFNQNTVEKEFDEYFDNEKDKCINFWKDALNKTSFMGSDYLEKLFRIVKSNLAYILINKDELGIQPGSRSYERSWIRDGSLTSTALLRFGFNYDVKEFIRWYGNHIYENGKVPCVVDKRGPDPVDEHDSHGEFLYLLHTYFEFSKDTALLREFFPIVKKIVSYIDSLTSLRKAEKYLNDTLLAYYGLMPESISHEGYSAKPMHSFWDNFFTVRGLRDATNIAKILNKNDDSIYFKKIKAEFQDNLVKSINRTIANHKIDYIPGCVELGDFDPTSTSIVFFPCNFEKYLPQVELRNSFEKYYDFIYQRKLKKNFENFTPYELRNINSFVFLNQKERAFELLDFMLNYQRPSGWNHWAEVVWRDSSKPEFIGDMPHTWVGSDFINAFRNMFAYEDETNSTLILLMGFNERFINRQNFFEIRNLITTVGNLNLSLQKLSEHKLNIMINGSLDLSNWKLALSNPLNKKIKSVMIDGKMLIDVDHQKIEINKIPAIVQINYE